MSPLGLVERFLGSPKSKTNWLSLGSRLKRSTAVSAIASCAVKLKPGIAGAAGAVGAAAAAVVVVLLLTVGAASAAVAKTRARAEVKCMMRTKD